MDDKSKGIISIKSSEDSFMESTGSILSGAIGSIPVVGSFLSGIFGAFWPGPKYMTVEDFQKEIKKLKEEMIAMMDSKIEAALDKVFNAIIDTEVVSLIDSGNNFSDAVNLWAERNGQKVSNLPKKKSKFAMEIQDLGDDSVKELCRTQYQIFTDTALRCINVLSDERFIEYSLSSLTFSMAHYVSSQLECIANGTSWGFPEEFIEGLNSHGEVTGVKNKLHQKINKFHMDFGKGYNRALKKGANPGDGNMHPIISAAGLINYSDKKLYQYPVAVYVPETNGHFVMDKLQKTYVPYTHFFRNRDTTKDDGIVDHVTHHYQITPLPNLYQHTNLFTYKFSAPPTSKKLIVNLHLATFGSVEHKIFLTLNGFQYNFSTNSLPMNCPTMEVIRTSIVSGGQVPSDIKYGIYPKILDLYTNHTSNELKISFEQVNYSKSDFLHIVDINFTLLE
ncbi:hypothetical protein DLAC_10678 [Tieghemostelium lacteum]|uniref:Pesticidal crystal protein N-terminal domain-containing protein n=1 Tax=Tieghemostelium lacteum TaxID=361077 RepID=A0A151Z4H5_TIELA|nr:hypothetical protein DLAC_10678 [Tieghemostelium lacteum]|eukprot:KYQ88872.1 hypothetical protein DLAC_10678 [Tieghemostelium lacteum]